MEPNLVQMIINLCAMKIDMNDVMITSSFSVIWRHNLVQLSKKLKIYVDPKLSLYRRTSYGLFTTFPDLKTIICPNMIISKK